MKQLRENLSSEASRSALTAPSSSYILDIAFKSTITLVCTLINLSVGRSRSSFTQALVINICFIAYSDAFQISLFFENEESDLLR